MSIFVLDCSVAVSWCFEDEASVETDLILDMVLEHGAYVPNLWHLEVCNVLLQVSKRERLKQSEIQVRLDDLFALPIKTDMETHAAAFRATSKLAITHNLTSYDAAYLELALRRSLPLATKDLALQKAAIAENIHLIPVK